MIKSSALSGFARASPVFATIISMSTTSANAATNEVADMTYTADYLGGSVKIKLAA